MNRKELNDICYIARCINCGTLKWSVPTIFKTGKPMLSHLASTSRCCDKPLYLWNSKVGC